MVKAHPPDSWWNPNPRRYPPTTSTNGMKAPDPRLPFGGIREFVNNKPVVVS